MKDAQQKGLQAKGRYPKTLNASFWALQAADAVLSGVLGEFAEYDWETNLRGPPGKLQYRQDGYGLMQKNLLDKLFSTLRQMNGPFTTLSSLHT